MPDLPDKLGSGRGVPEVGRAFDALIGSLQSERPDATAAGGTGRTQPLRVEVLACVVVDRRFAPGGTGGGSGAITDGQTIMAGDTVEYRVRPIGGGTGGDSSWLTPANRYHADLPHRPAPDGARCFLSRWPTGTANGRVARLELLDQEVIVGGPCEGAPS